MVCHAKAKAIKNSKGLANAPTKKPQGGIRQNKNDIKSLDWSDFFFSLNKN